MANVIVNKSLAPIIESATSFNQDKLSLAPPPQPYKKTKKVTFGDNLIYEPIYNEINKQIAQDSLALEQKEAYENAKYTPSYEGASTLSYSGLGVKRNYENKITKTFAEAMSIAARNTALQDLNNTLIKARQFYESDISMRPVTSSGNESSSAFPKSSSAASPSTSSPKSYFQASALILNDPPKGRARAQSAESNLPRKVITEPPKIFRAASSYMSESRQEARAVIPPTKKVQVGPDFLLKKQTSQANGYTSTSSEEPKYVPPPKVLDAKKAEGQRIFDEMTKNQGRPTRGPKVDSYYISSDSNNQSSGSNYSDKKGKGKDRKN